VAKWLGNSPKIAAQHYLMTREHHFDDVVAVDMGTCDLRGEWVERPPVTTPDNALLLVDGLRYFPDR